MSEEFAEHGFIDSVEENLYYWKAATLWKLAEAMTVEHIPLENFDWTNENFQCEDLSSPPLWRDIGDHAKRIFAADLQYPIVMSAEGHVMDAMHRILKCYAFGLPTVKAVRFTTNPPPDRIVPIKKAQE